MTANELTARPLERAVAHSAEPAKTADGRVDVRSDAGAVSFLQRNQAVAATLDASTIVVDPAYRDSRTVISHELAHIAQLRSGLIASRGDAERAADGVACGTRSDAGGAATPPLFQLARPTTEEPVPFGPEAQERSTAEMRDLALLGTPVPGVKPSVEIRAGATEDPLARGIEFHATVTGSGENGDVKSRTDFTARMDREQRYGFSFVGPAKGPATGTVLDIEGVPHAAAPAPAVDVPIPPVVVTYQRELSLIDRDGRSCTVIVKTFVDFSYETWKRETAGREVTLETLRSAYGDKAHTAVLISADGPVQRYDVGVSNDAPSIDEGMRRAQDDLENSDRFKDAAGLPMTFIRPGQTAGEQFLSLDAVLVRMDEKEIERHGKPQLAKTSGGGDPGDAPPAWSRGVMSTLEKALLWMVGIFVAVALLAELPGITLGMAVAWVGATLLASALGNALIARVKEAVNEHVYNPFSILSAAVLDTFGAGQLYEATTDTSLLSGRELNRTEEERWESGSAGVLGLLMSAFGVRSAAKSYRPRPLDPVVPGEPPPVRPPLEDHPGMEQWTEGHDPSPQVVTRLNQARCTIGEQGVAFAGYPRSRGWAFIDGPSGAGGHAWNRPGFDGVAFRFDGPFEMEIIDNKAFASASNVSDASAITRNLQTNLTDLSVQIADPVYDTVPRIADVRTSVANARTALQNGTPLPPEIRLVVTNFGGQSQGISAALQALGIIFRNSN